MLMKRMILLLSALLMVLSTQADGFDDLQQALGLPENVIPFAIASIGYPASPKAEDGRNYDFSRVHRDRY